MQQTITLSDLISQDILQELQDAFSRCVGTAALITDASGTPLTRGSGYSPFCGLTRHSSLGCERCAESDIEGGPHAITSGEVSVYHCKMGLLDFAAPIKVGSECIGALVGGQVGFFASDVFVHEPATPENTPLLKLPNVIATSHNGAETYENLEKCGIMTAQQIIDALEGREPINRRV